MTKKQPNFKKINEVHQNLTIFDYHNNKLNYKYEEETESATITPEDNVKKLPQEEPKSTLFTLAAEIIMGMYGKQLAKKIKTKQNQRLLLVGDLHPHIIEQFKNHFQVDVNFPNHEEYDIVFLAYKIEHNQNISHTIKTCGDLVKKHGSLIIQTPKLNSKPAHRYHHYWNQLQTNKPKKIFTQAGLTCLIPPEFSCTEIDADILINIFDEIQSRLNKRGRTQHLTQLLKGYTIKHPCKEIIKALTFIPKACKRSFTNQKTNSMGNQRLIFIKN
jgi:hypothetical protein